MPTLHVFAPDRAEAVYALAGERVSIGREPDNTIQIPDSSISAHHAEFLLEHGHYRLHDLRSTNLTFVEEAEVRDFHLLEACAIRFGGVECAYDPDPTDLESGDEFPISLAEMEKDLAFLRAENQELLHKIASLQKQIDILSSARLVTSKADVLGSAAPAEVKRLLGECDELGFHNSELRLELENRRAELEVVVRERDLARRACELLLAERSSRLEKGKAFSKGTTQRLPQASSATGELARSQS